jgi:hypothetical protein
MHQRRAKESLDVVVPDVVEKGKWIFNPRNQASHEESHITKCQIFIESRYKVTWTSKVEIQHMV